MKAWVLHDIGDIRYEDLQIPGLRDTDVLVEVRAAGICGSDIPRIYRDGAHKMPLVPGHEFSGQVVDVGKSVDKIWKGKRVGVFPLIPCKNCRPCMRGMYEMCRQYDYLGSRRNGGFAEYVAVPVWNLVELQETISFEEAAMLEPMAVAVHAMRRVKICQNDVVVVYGLGTIGQLLIMFLLQQGISNLLVIGNKEFQKQTVLQQGVKNSHYIDSRNKDVKESIMQYTNGYGADVVFECIGRNDTIAQAIDLAAPAGEICMIGNPSADVLLKQEVYWKILRHQLRVTGTWNSSYGGDNDWSYVCGLLREKSIHPSELITHRFAMENLDQGFHIMRDKTEDYIKIMMSF